MPAFSNPEEVQPGWYGGRSSKPPVGIGSACDPHRVWWLNDEPLRPSTCDSFGARESAPGLAVELTLFAYNAEQASAFAAMYPEARILYPDDRPNLWHDEH